MEWEKDFIPPEIQEERAFVIKKAEYIYRCMGGGVYMVWMMCGDNIIISHLICTEDIEADDISLLDTSIKELLATNGTIAKMRIPIRWLKSSKGK